MQLDKNQMESGQEKSGGLIFNIQRYSVHDGPGIRTTVFFQGCPLRCFWCSNPESQSNYPVVLFNKKDCIQCGACLQVCPSQALHSSPSSPPFVEYQVEHCVGCGACSKVCCTQAISSVGNFTTTEEVIREVIKDQAFYRNSDGGVTFSGGEVLGQIDFLIDLCYAAKAENIHTAIETSGFGTWTSLASLTACVDLFLFDLKHYDGEKHKLHVGVDLDLIVSNLKKLLSQTEAVVVRIPVIPDFNDSVKDAYQFGLLLQSLQVQEVHLLAFHQLGKHKYTMLGLPYLWEDKKAVEKEDLGFYQNILARFVPLVKII